jgi:hypothetical protein
MNRYYRSTVSLICGLALLITGTSVLAAGKIAPSRTLKGSGAETGILSVFSEPPGLVVTLDGAQIGKTPVRGLEVKTGSHFLQIGESKTEIYITPDKPLNLSWRRGIFIVTASQEKTEPAQPKADEKNKSQKTKTADTKKDGPELEPLYWPLNPTGPIF